MLGIRSARWSASQISQSLLATQSSSRLQLHNKLKCRQLHSTSSLCVLQLKMPSLSPTMEEGTIVSWLKKEGESLEAGDVICDIQTDKAVVSMEVDEEGVLAKIVMSSDAGTIKIGEVIALVAEDGEDWNAVAKMEIKASAPVAEAAPAAAPPVVAATPPPPAAVATPSPPKAAAAPVAAAPSPPASSASSIGLLNFNLYSALAPVIPTAGARGPYIPGTLWPAE